MCGPHVFVLLRYHQNFRVKYVTIKKHISSVLAHFNAINISSDDDDNEK